MKYALKGHAHRHAVEEMLLHLLPAATVEEDAQAGESEEYCLSALEEAEGEIIAQAEILLAGQKKSGMRRAAFSGADALEKRRIENELVKLAIYDAVLPCLSIPPVWGSLTGVRPAKLARGMTERGMSNAQAADRLRSYFGVSPSRAALTIRAAAVAADCKARLLPGDVSVYISIPFCPSRCRYCSFVSASIENQSHFIEPYLDALCSEIEITGEILRRQKRRVSSIYIGGGTPTTLSAEQMTRLMDAVKAHIGLHGVAEYTVEAGRPDTITGEKLLALQAGGATRISINPQTMDEAVLEKIGRRHSVKQVMDSFALARSLGFANINMDVIAGLSGDTPARFQATMEKITALGPESITVHTLAIKRGADLTDREENQRRYSAVSAMLEGTGGMLTARGYAPYYLYRQKFTAGGFENTGWCKPGSECIYNVYMMEELQTIVSLGAGAVSKRVVSETGKITRYSNPKYPVDYLQAAARIRQAKEKLLEP